MNSLRKYWVGRWTFAVATGLLATLWLTGGAWAEKNYVPVQLISLKLPAMSGELFTVSTQRVITFKNDHKEALHHAVLTHVSSGKTMFSVKEIKPGQSMGLEFTRSGNYRMCYAQAPDTGSLGKICIRLNVVSLKTT